MPVKWTNRSRPPSSGVMKPKPLSSLNHLTVPVAMNFPSPTAFGRFGWLPRAPNNAGTVASSASSVPEQPPRALDRVIPGHDLMREARFLELREDPADLGPGPDPELARQLVSADRRTRRVGLPAKRLPEHLVCQLEMLGDRPLGVVSARREPVRDAQHGDVHGHRLAAAQVAVDSSPG